MFHKCLVNEGKRGLSVDSGGMVTLKKRRKASKLEKWLKRQKVNLKSSISKATEQRISQREMTENSATCYKDIK